MLLECRVRRRDQIRIAPSHAEYVRTPLRTVLPNVPSTYEYDVSKVKLTAEPHRQDSRVLQIRSNRANV